MQRTGSNRDSCFLPWAATSRPAALLAGLAAFALAAAAGATTIVPTQTITSDTTWTAAGSPYYLNNAAVTVAAGATLTVNAGAIVKLAAGWIAVQGGLVTQGTGAAPVVFTSYRDDTVGGDTDGGGPSTGAVGDWFRVQLEEGSTGTIAHTAFRYGGGNTSWEPAGQHMVVVRSTGVQLSDCEISNSAQYGLTTYGSGRVQVANCAFADQPTGINFWSDVPGTITGSSFANHSYAPILCQMPNATLSTITGNSASGAGFKGIRLVGSLLITQGGSWTSTGLPYYLDSAGVSVTPTATLTIQPGVIVKLGGGSIGVLGGLVTQGTAGSPVVFTSYRDDTVGGDTNGDGPSAGAVGDWFRVQLEGGSTGTIAHTAFRYGGGNTSWTPAGQHMVVVRSTGVQLSECEFSNSAQFGLTLYGSGKVQVADCAFADQYAGINLWSDVPGTITGSSFANHAYAPILVQMPNATLSTITGNSVSGAGPKGIRLVGSLPISQSGSWTSTELPYFVDNAGVTVTPGATLTVNAGVIVKLGGGAVVVQGGLVTAGTAGSPVVFTSYRDDTVGGDTNGDGASTGAVGDWFRVQLEEGSTGTIAHTAFRYGGGNTSWEPAGQHMVVVRSTGVQLTDCEISHSAQFGLTVYGSGKVQAANCAFADQYAGINFWSDVPGTITGSSFANHAYAPILIQMPNATLSTITGNSVSGTGPKGIRLVGTLPITQNGSWTSTELPYYLDGASVAVGSGATLTIQAGVVVKLNQGSIGVSGRLLTQGTGAAPVVFTSYRDDSVGGDTNGDGASTGAVGDWFRVQLEEGSTGTIAHTAFRYGGGNTSWEPAGQHMVVMRSTGVQLTDCEIGHSAQFGLTVYGSGKVQVANCAFADQYAGINFWSDVPGTITGSSFANHAYAPILIQMPNATLSTISGNSASGAGFKGIRLVGTLPITQSGRWTSRELPYYLDNAAVTLGGGSTLAVDPGVIVKLMAGLIVVDGSLVAAGTAGEPVVFTSYLDDAYGGDTNGDGASQGFPGDWQRVQLQPGSTGYLNHVVMRFGGGSTSAEPAGQHMLVVRSPEVTVANSEIARSAEVGVMVYGAGAPTIADSEIAGHTRGVHFSGAGLGLAGSVLAGNGHALYSDTATDLVIAEDTFLGNGAAVTSAGGASISAHRCFWGDGSGPFDASDDRGTGGWYNPDGRGDPVTDSVDYTPWMRTSRRLGVPLPSSHERWVIGRSRTLFFTPLHSSMTVDVALSRDGGATWETLATGQPNTGTFDWMATGPAASTCVIRVADSADSSVAGTGHPFEIAGDSEPVHLAGRLTDLEGRPLQGLIVEAAGADTVSTRTDSAGVYLFGAFGRLAGGTYRVTPESVAPGLEPAYRDVDLDGGTVAQDFVLQSATCLAPVILKAVDDARVQMFRAATLTVPAAGAGPLHFQWFEGASGDTSAPVGEDAPSFTTPVLALGTQYWVRAASACDPPADSEAASVIVMPIGDATGDGTVNVSDVFYEINALFAGGSDAIGTGDVNGDGQVNVADVFYLINYLFAGGPPPVS